MSPWVFPTLSRWASLTVCLIFRVKHCVMCSLWCFRACRSSSRPERRSSALTSKRSSPSWATAAPSISGKVRLCFWEVRWDREGRVCESCEPFSFQCLTLTWRWLDTKWRRALTGKHLEAWKLCSWPLVRIYTTPPRTLLVLRPQMWSQMIFKWLHLLSFSFAVKCARSVPAYFAETLYYAMKVRWNSGFFRVFWVLYKHILTLVFHKIEATM